MFLSSIKHCFNCIRPIFKFSDVKHTSTTLSVVIVYTVRYVLVLKILYYKLEYLQNK